MADGELRQLLDEWGAWLLSERLGGARLPFRIEGAPLDLVAEVLAVHHGDPMRLLDGEPLPSRSSSSPLVAGQSQSAHNPIE